MTKDRDTTTELDIEQLIQELTLSEKISLLAGNDFWHTVPVKRLGIPSIRTSDGPNGIRGTKFFNGVPSNSFPCGTAMASTFNKELLEEAGELMGKEARMKGTHVVLGPTCNIVRSPLGGRGFESYSEDPLLSGHAASHVIQGIQNKEKILACIKHYVCNDLEDERKSVDTIITERALREIYLKPFQIALRDSNPKSMMTAYNKVNGIHVSQSKKLLQDILRKEWGYEGTVMSDWFGTYSIKESLDAGLNLEMPGPTRFREDISTSHKVYSNEIHIDVIDENVRYILKMVNEAIKSGIPENAPEVANESQEASAFIRKIGGESIVLLKNESNILPLSNQSSKGNEKFAIIGPNAKTSQDSGGGSASLNARYKTTPYEGIKEKLEEAGNSVSLEYELGASLDKTLPDIGHLLKTESGESGLTATFYEEDPSVKSRKPFEKMHMDSSKVFLADFKSDKLKPGQLLFYIDFEGTFSPEETGTYEFGCSCLGTAQLFINNKLVVDNKTKQKAGNAFFLGMGTDEVVSEIELKKGNDYKVRVEFGTCPTSSVSGQFLETGGVYFGARLKTTPEEKISRAVELAKKVDKVILCIGLTKDWETEGFDRPNMDIPGYSEQLIKAVSEANPNVIVVNQSGTPVTIAPWINKVSALVQAWYGGIELGNSIADVLFGDVNPSGKLSMTFPERLEDTPSFVNFASTNGRVLYGEDVFVGYRYYEKVKRNVLYPFGYGLSYTSFDFKDLKVSATEDLLTSSVTITNTGKVEGSETVQLYIKPENPSIIRPIKELKEFGKVHLAPGESKTVKLNVSIKEATSFWDTYKDKWCSEKGDYTVQVGNSSDNILLEERFTTEKTFYWLGL